MLASGSPSPLNFRGRGVGVRGLVRNVSDYVILHSMIPKNTWHQSRYEQGTHPGMKLTDCCAVGATSWGSSTVGAVSRVIGLSQECNYAKR
jgi:hypothetical protein